jgi:hypothetical protein
MSQPRSKIFVEIGEHYLFSLKRAPDKPEKDRLLELIGGKQEDGETPFEALIRELAEEEESGILVKRVLASRPTARNVIVSNSLHQIYNVTLDQADYARLTASPEESYGFQLIPKNLMESAADFRPDLFTPKTIKIFRALNIPSGGIR